MRDSIRLIESVLSLVVRRRVSLGSNLHFDYDPICHVLRAIRNKFGATQWWTYSWLAKPSRLSRAGWLATDSPLARLQCPAGLDFGNKWT